MIILLFQQTSNKEQIKVVPSVESRDFSNSMKWLDIQVVRLIFKGTEQLYVVRVYKL